MQISYAAPRVPFVRLQLVPACDMRWHGTCRFVHTYECAGGFKYNLTEPIEPLTSLLRDPLSWECPRDSFANDTVRAGPLHRPLR